VVGLGQAFNDAGLIITGPYPRDTLIASRT
jgi:hypothetical protein